MDPGQFAGLERKLISARERAGVGLSLKVALSRPPVAQINSHPRHPNKDNHRDGDEHCHCSALAADAGQARPVGCSAAPIVR